MPLTSKGKKIMKSMKKSYGKKEGKKVFYASANKGTIKGVHHTTLSPNMVGHEGLFKMVNCGEGPDAKEVKTWKSGAVRRDIEK
jgi:hypothetical protein